MFILDTLAEDVMI